MKVGIYLERRSVLNFARRIPNEELFLSNFDTISLQVLEPNCPFCGKVMQNARCYCKKFETAKKSFLSKYENKNLFIRKASFGAIFSYPIRKNNVKIVETKENGNSLFSSKHSKIQAIGSLYYAISEGVIENGVLSFYVQVKGSNIVNKCTIENLNFPTETNDSVIIYFLERRTIMRSYSRHTLGNYQLDFVENEVDKIVYSDYLQRLNEQI